MNFAVNHFPPVGVHKFCTVDRIASSVKLTKAEQPYTSQGLLGNLRERIHLFSFCIRSI